MSGAMRIWLIVGAVLLLTGLIIFGVAIGMAGWDFTRLSTTNFETNEYEIKENFQGITVVTDTADVAVLPSENEEIRIVCYESEHERHSVSVKDGTLAVELTDTRKWYDHIGLHFESARITVYLPSGEYGALTVRSSTGETEVSEGFTFDRITLTKSTGDIHVKASATGLIKLKTSTGDIRMENVQAGAIELSTTTGKAELTSVACAGDTSVNVSTGKVHMAGVTCKNLISSGITGNVFLKNTVAAERFSVERTSGDVRLEGCDASALRIKTVTGSVEGTLLSDKVFVARSTTGDIRVPDTSKGGKCEVATTTGDIKIEIQR